MKSQAQDTRFKGRRLIQTSPTEAPLQYPRFSARTSQRQSAWYSETHTTRTSTSSLIGRTCLISANRSRRERSGFLGRRVPDSLETGAITINSDRKTITPPKKPNLHRISVMSSDAVNCVNKSDSLHRHFLNISLLPPRHLDENYGWQSKRSLLNIYDSVFRGGT